MPTEFIIGGVESTFNLTGFEPTMFPEMSSKEKKYSISCPSNCAKLANVLHNCLPLSIKHSV